MRVRIDNAGHHEHAGRVDDVLARSQARSNLGNLAVADEDVGVMLAAGRHDPTTADHHLLTRQTAGQAPISYRCPGSRARPLTTCQRAATALRALRPSNGARSVPFLSTLTRPW